MGVFPAWLNLTDTTEENDSTLYRGLNQNFFPSAHFSDPIMMERGCE